MSQPAPHAASLSIGEVLDELRAEFPDVSISKIRYLETEGLVEPARTPAGYRKFSRADVERLHFVLRLQRDRFWPLKVIRQKLDDLDRGLAPTDEDGGALQVPRLVLGDDGRPTAQSLDVGSAGQHYQRPELLRACGIDEDLLDQAEEHGLVRPVRGRYADADLMIARTLVELASYGLEPRHLRSFRTAADREVGLVDQVVEPIRRRTDAGAAARAEQTSRELAALGLRLHTMLVASALQGRR
ncbi:MerR-like DNA binding protein [Mumia flava]|uniref:MerR-like DNA binding protein n=1 Tax=Mumia flava TaxID=1348852 RepID=A0A0B2B8Z4_9ACTN|nr:MerR family transcriptional regulator [Mumia flava]PJJ53409.1 MerR-like DNA binding protein [Mumia flava]